MLPPRQWSSLCRPCRAPCRPALDAVDGLECQVGGTWQQDRVCVSQGPVVPALPAPSPLGASLCPHRPHALPRPRQAPLCRSPRPAKAEHRGPGEGCGQRGAGSWPVWERKKGLENVFSLVYPLSPSEGGGGVPPRAASSAWVGFCCWRSAGCRGPAEPGASALSFAATLLFEPVPSRLSVEPPLGHGLRKHRLLGPGWPGAFGLGWPCPRGPALGARPAVPEGPARGPPADVRFLQIVARALLTPTAGAGATPCCWSPAPEGPLGPPLPRVGAGQVWRRRHLSPLFPGVSRAWAVT